MHKTNAVPVGKRVFPFFKKSVRNGLLVCLAYINLNLKKSAMADSYTQNYIHYVFSTKHRNNLILPEFDTRVWKYIGGIANKNNMKAIKVGGMPDHIHALISLHPTISISKAIQLIKGGSSKWINDNFYDARTFRWQSGYGAFSVSASKLTDVVSYIANQKEHHKTKTFKKEYIGLLHKHNIDFDERYVFD